MFYACNAQGGRAAMRYSIDAPLAMAYVPMQQWCKIYPSDVGFTRGTIFEQLDLPFIGEEAVPNGK